MKSLIFLIAVFCSVQAFGLAGHLAKVVEPQGDSKNWAVKNPQIYFILGPIGADMTKHYTDVAKKFESALKATHPEITVSVLANATTPHLVYTLQDPSTVGVIIISHTFKTLNGLTGILIDSAFTGIPNEILSAATPALRFMAFFGCYGPQAIKNYQVEYEMPRMPGQQRVYYTTDESLSTGDFIFGDGVANAVSDLERDIEALDFQSGDDPWLATGMISVSAKDVVAGQEPRYVEVNGYIVGVLGDAAFANTGLGFENFQYGVNDWVLKNPRCQGGLNRVVLRSAELTPGFPADDYQLAGVQLNVNWQQPRQLLFGSPLHLGDDATPMVEVPQQPGPLPPAAQEYYKHLPPDVVKEWEHRRWAEYLMKKFKFDEWLDRDATHWPALSGRFYSGCM